MDEATYALIGAAYGEVEAKEPWCRGVTAAADVALLTIEALHPGQDEDHGNLQGKSDTAPCACCSKASFCSTSSTSKRTSARTRC